VIRELQRLLNCTTILVGWDRGISLDRDTINNTLCSVRGLCCLGYGRALPLSAILGSLGDLDRRA